MSWKVVGRSMELCSCEMLCPCWLGGTGEPDQGWCGGAFAFDVEEGTSDGVDLSGTKVALGLWWPGNFFGGQGTGRVYVDESASEEQRRELEAIFSGGKGGHLEGLWGAVIDQWLPSEVTQVEIEWGENPTLKVGAVGFGTLEPLKDGNGKPTRVEGAAAQAGLAYDSMDLASSIGSRWSDPDLQSWEGNSGTLHAFDWQA